MLMQNWGHVEYVFEHLNLQPREANGCDYSRAKHWYLDGHSKYYRQTVIYSYYLTPELNKLFSKQMRNISGKFKYRPKYEGAMWNLGINIKQTFVRLNTATPESDPDDRFKYFANSIIPSLQQINAQSNIRQNTLIFIPSYLDFVRIRNYFATSNATDGLRFGTISEYSEHAEVRRSRAHFSSGHYSVLLYTGRAHHFRRYHLQGVGQVIMYAAPDNPSFYCDIVKDFVGSRIADGELQPEFANVRILFSKWDGMKIERIVGSERTKKLLYDRKGDIFEFV